MFESELSLKNIVQVTQLFRFWCIFFIEGIPFFKHVLHIHSSKKGNHHFSLFVWRWRCGNYIDGPGNYIDLPEDFFHKAHKFCVRMLAGVDGFKQRNRWNIHFDWPSCHWWPDSLRAHMVVPFNEGGKFQRASEI